MSSSLFYWVHPLFSPPSTRPVILRTFLPSAVHALSPAYPITLSSAFLSSAIWSCSPFSFRSFLPSVSTLSTPSPLSALSSVLSSLSCAYPQPVFPHNQSFSTAFLPTFMLNILLFTWMLYCSQTFCTSHHIFCIFCDILLRFSSHFSDFWPK